ncbi:MAG: hypothetical protein ACK5NA_07820 [Enterococcus sp.]
MKKLSYFVCLSVLALSGCAGATKNNDIHSITENSNTKASQHKHNSTANSSSSEKTTSTESTRSEEKHLASEESSSSYEEHADGTTDASTSISVKNYTDAQKEKINAQFLAWTNERAKAGNLAVNSEYFNHGASGSGDWYAVTSDGVMQIQQQDLQNGKPGYSAFPIHAIGGVVWYSSKFETVGVTDEVNSSENNPSIATGFSEVADQSKPITKYLLGDNGVVYEAITEASFSSGFSVASDEGTLDTTSDSSGQLIFTRSEDQAAQRELQNILNEIN